MVLILFNSENDVGVIVVHVKTLRQSTRFRPQIFPTSESHPWVSGYYRHHRKLNVTGILKVQLERLVFVPNHNVFLGNHSILECKRGKS